MSFNLKVGAEVLYSLINSPSSVKYLDGFLFLMRPIFLYSSILTSLRKENHLDKFYTVVLNLLV